MLSYGKPGGTNIDYVIGPHQGSLGPYVKTEKIFKCPADRSLTKLADGNSYPRVRSYSMNAMVGDVGDLSQAGVNRNNPDYVQFFNMSSIPEPAKIFVFLHEHPDSINDGYFINKADYWEWIDLPASYHNGAASFSFADGHSETHRWRVASTKPPSQPDGAPLPMKLPKSDWGDFDWVIDRMSVDRD